MRRRNFIQLTSATIFLVPLLSCNGNNKGSSQVDIPHGTKFLFAGDSITGAMRDVRFEDKPNNIYGLGNGFVSAVTGELLRAYPLADLHFYNRGIAGIKTPELLDRWDKSCLNLQPDVVTIMVGAVDYIQTVRRGYEGTLDLFQSSLDQILARTQKALPQTQLIVMEPYLLDVSPMITAEVKEGFLPYQQVVKALSQKYKAIYIETQIPLEAAASKNSAAYWCSDGIHPSPAGISLLADLWTDGLAGR